MENKVNILHNIKDIDQNMILTLKDDKFMNGEDILINEELYKKDKNDYNKKVEDIYYNQKSIEETNLIKNELLPQYEKYDDIMAKKNVILKENGNIKKIDENIKNNINNKLNYDPKNMVSLNEKSKNIIKKKKIKINKNYEDIKLVKRDLNYNDNIKNIELNERNYDDILEFNKNKIKNNQNIKLNFNINSNINESKSINEEIDFNDVLKKKENKKIEINLFTDNYNENEEEEEIKEKNILDLNKEKVIDLFDEQEDDNDSDLFDKSTFLAFDLFKKEGYFKNNYFQGRFGDFKKELRDINEINHFDKYGNKLTKKETYREISRKTHNTKSNNKKQLTIEKKLKKIKDKEYSNNSKIDMIMKAHKKNSNKHYMKIN